MGKSSSKHSTESRGQSTSKNSTESRNMRNTLFQDLRYHERARLSTNEPIVKNPARSKLKYSTKLVEGNSRSPEAGYQPRGFEDYSSLTEAVYHPRRFEDYSSPPGAGKLIVSNSGSPELKKITVSKSSKNQELPKYETGDKRGLLILINDEFESDMELALPIFDLILGFNVKVYNSSTDRTRDVRQFLKDVKEEIKTNASKYYCVVFLISCHGKETGMEIGDEIISMGEMAKKFSNENLVAFAGRPKVFVADCCRGRLRESKVTNKKSVAKQRSSHAIATQDSDIIIVFATTKGKFAWANEVSLLHKVFIETLSDKWANSHLEEMLIYVRNEVVNWEGEEGEKQTVEVISTLTKALTFCRPSYVLF